MTRSNKNAKGVSDDLFHAAATLATRLAFIAEYEFKIEPIELFLIWHIKNYGQADSEGRPVLLRHDLTDVFKKKFGYSDSDISKLIDGLHDDGLLEKGNLTTQERTALFGTESSSKLAVRLQAAGLDKIEAFKNFLRDKFDTWLSEQSTTTKYATRKFEPIALGFAQWLLDRYQPSSSSTKE